MKRPKARRTTDAFAFHSFRNLEQPLFIGASVLTQAQITKAKGDWYSKVEVVVWMCPDGTSQSVNCTAGTAATQTQINDLQKTIRNELADDVSQITFVSKEDFYNDTFLKQYPNG